MERMASQSKKTGPPLSLSKDSGYSGSLKDKLQSPVSSWKAEDTDCILRHFRFLKDEIYIKPLVDLFFQDGDLDEDDMEEILGQRSRRNSVDIFVRKFLRLNADSFGRFLIYLRKTEQTHIADSLTQEHIVIEDLPDTNLSKHDMETSILMNLELLCDDLEPDKVADYFLQYRVFTIDEYESIISHRTRRKKAVEMVGLILENLPKSFLVLKHIYREKGKYLMLYSLHDVRTSENQSEINTSIREQLEMKRRDVHCTCMLYPPGFFNAKMRLHADHQQSSGFEKNIVDSLQNKVEEINEELRKMSNCKIVLVKSGSIVIYLLSCGPMLRQNNNIQEDVDTLLKVMFNHPAVATFGCYNGLRFNVTVEKPVQECFDQQRMTGISF